MEIASVEEERQIEMDSQDLEVVLLELLRRMSAAIANASQVTVVISALHSLASLLWKLPAQGLLDGDAVGEYGLGALKEWAKICRMRALNLFPEKDPQEILRHALYEGPAFTALVNLLLHKVAPDWLACFPSMAQAWLFDEIFTGAPPREALLALAPSLTSSYETVEDSDSGFDSSNAVSSQARRLLNICLIERQGIKDMALAFSLPAEAGHKLDENLKGGGDDKRDGQIGGSLQLQTAQLVSSIPDRAGLKAPPALQSPAFFQSLSKQLLTAGEERWLEGAARSLKLNEMGGDGSFMFIGEVIGRLCRRGHAGILASVMVPVLIQHVPPQCPTAEVFDDGDPPDLTFESIKRTLEDSFWPAVVACVKDSHAMERWVEALLREMAAKPVSDWQAYCILYMLFGSLLSWQSNTRMVFKEKLLFIKILPICCLKWILDFAVLQSPPPFLDSSPTLADQPPYPRPEKHLDTGVVRRLGQVWSSNDFIRSTSMCKQAYMTAALGMCIRAMEKEDMESCGNLLQYLLEGVSHRLESPLPLIRQMAKRVALAFSVVINPNNPLLLDDGDDTGDLDDWEGLDLGVAGSLKKHQTLGATADPDIDSQSWLIGRKSSELRDGEPHVELSSKRNSDEKRERRRQRRERRERLAMEEDDPDVAVNLGGDNGAWQMEDGEISSGGTGSDSGSEGSLQPYDMSDDDSELQRHQLPSQLSDCTINLRRGDDPNAVELALQVAERLVRAMPAELDNAAGDLIEALVHVRCSAIAVEGQEGAAEDKRHQALVALLVCSTFNSIGVLTRALFSPHVDSSQRLLILDVMSDAAQELAGAGHFEADTRSQTTGAGLVTELLGTSQRPPWYEPGVNHGLIGAGPWVEVPAPIPGGSLVSWAHSYEREIPLREGERKLGRSRTWAPRSMQLRHEKRRTGSVKMGSGAGKNRFPPFAVSFMLPIMRDYDKKSQGVDLLGSDFIVLAKLIYTLGVFMECLTSQPEAPVLGAALLDLLQSRAIASHAEAFVRRAALYAASRVMGALHPSQVVSALTSGDASIGTGLEWIRSWAVRIADNDPDTECSTMAMACVQLHSEMAFQAMRALQSLPTLQSGAATTLHTSSLQGPIIMPF